MEICVPFTEFLVLITNFMPFQTSNHSPRKLAPLKSRLLPTFPVGKSSPKLIDSTGRSVTWNLFVSYNNEKLFLFQNIST